MKKILLISALLLSCITSFAQTGMFVKLTSGVTDVYPIVTTLQQFDASGTTMTVNGTVNYAVSDIEEITYGSMPTSITVNYAGDKATAVNPFAADGVSVRISGCDVTVNNNIEGTELTTELKGETTDGSFVYNGVYKTTIVLAGVSITNPDGAAIDIECGKRVAVELKKNTVNTLVDGKKGKQKAAFYCTGHLEFDKSGTLNVTSKAKHAISAKEYIQLKKSDGYINILGAESDGIHCGQYFLANGFNVTMSKVKGDGVQAELSGDDDYDEDYADGCMIIQGGTFKMDLSGESVAGFKCDTDLTISNGKSEPTLDITTSGNGSKGIKSNANVNISAGNISITQTGSSYVDGDDVDYVIGIKADLDVNITGGTVTINNTAEGGKGISADGTVNISDGATVVDNTVSSAAGR